MVIQLISQIFNVFNKNEFTLRLFVDLNEAFDTVDSDILLKKLGIFGINGRNLK